MDFDFGGATVEPTGSTNTLDFLGAQTSQPKNIPNSFNLFSQSSSTPQAPFSPPSQPSVGKGDLLGWEKYIGLALQRRIIQMSRWSAQDLWKKSDAMDVDD